jgi:outer membrane lipoprotein-sorting protein
VYRTMTRRAVLAGLLVTGMTGAANAQNVSSNIRDYVAAKLDDVTANMRVIFYDDQAGRKMGEGFEMIHKIKGNITMRYKEENKLRMDSRAPKVIFIVNGTTQYASLPSFNINTKIALGDTPGKRKTLMDVGLIGAGYLAYTQAEFRGTRPVDGVQCALFKISYKDKNLDTSHRMVWIDPKTKVTVKREEYSQEGKLNGTFFYKNAQEVAPGIWFPSIIEVHNNDGKKAGVTQYSNIKVNQGLDDSLFKL